MIDANFPSLSRAVSTSLLGRSVAAAGASISTAWASSHTRQWMGAVDGILDVRGIALLACTAGAIATIAQMAIPVYVRSSLPIFWPITAVLAAAVIAIWPEPFTRAWSHSFLRSLSRRSFSEGG